MNNPWLKTTPQLHASQPAETLGARLYDNRRKRKIAVAIIGLDAEVAEKTREALYTYSWGFADLTIVDQGNLRKATADFLTPLLRELHASGTIPLLFGADPALFQAQYLAFGELNRQVSVLNVDQRLNITDPGLRNRKRFHLAHLGAQEHLLLASDRRAAEQMGAESVRLGQARADLADLEPLIRDADLLGFNVSAVQFSEAPARAGYSPSGFNLQEASQLCYYAGNSDKLASCGFYGLDGTDRSATEVQLTAAAYAQLAWYFLKGIANRSGDFPATTEGMLEYVVDVRDFDRLTFWRSPRSNRWWMQIPAGTYRGEERHRLIPCSYADYTLASQGENLPKRLFRALRRFG